MIKFKDGERYRIVDAGENAVEWLFNEVTYRTSNPAKDRFGPHFEFSDGGYCWGDDVKNHPDYKGDPEEDEWWIEVEPVRKITRKVM